MGWCTAVMHVSACGWILMCVVFTYFDWISVLEKELYVRVLFVVQYDVSVKCHDKNFQQICQTPRTNIFEGHTKDRT